MTTIEHSLTRLSQPPELQLAPEHLSGNILGHLQAFRHDSLGLMMDAFNNCGDIARVRIGYETALFTANAEDVKRVLIDRHGDYSKQTRGYAVLRMVLGQGLVTSEGSFWKRQRRIAQPAFQRKRIAGFGDTMRAASEDLSVHWGEIARRGTSVDVAEEMMRLTLRIAGETLFSQDLSNQSAEVGPAVTEVMHYFNWLFKSSVPLLHHLPVPANVRGRRALKTLDRVVYDIIAQRRASGSGPLDLLDMFMNAYDEDTGERMSDLQLRDEVLTMLTAGHETTANGLAWTLYLLSKHPGILRRLQHELDEVLGDDEPDMMKLRELTYTNQVIQESMRLYPPVWAVARRAEQDDVLSGHLVKRGTYVVMSPYVIQRHPQYWDNPEGFDPDRFSPERLEQAKAEGRPKQAYFPFSIGPRKCIGDHFAKMESLIILATLLRRFTPSLVPGQRIEAETSITLRPKHGIQMTLSAR